MNERFAVIGRYYARAITTDAAPPRRSAAPPPIAAAFEKWRKRRVTDASAPAQIGAPPTEPKYNIGNRQFVVSLPAGEYNLVDGGDVIRVERDGEFVIALPSGFEYSAEDDAAGTHIYAKPAGQPDRVPLSDVPAALGHGAGRDTIMPAALARHNARMTQLYAPGNHRPDRPHAAADPALTRYADRMREFWSRGAA